MATISNIDVGATNITTLGTVTTGTWLSDAELTAGGTHNPSMVASNGGIVYSDASKLNILSGTATANQALLSGASGAPSWSTATYPLTATQGSILYGSATNVISTLTFATKSILGTDGSDVPQWIAAATSGYTLIGSTGAAPVGGTLTAGAGIAITTPGGSITVSLLPVVDQTVTSVTLVAGTTYIPDNAGLVTFTLATSPTAGDKYVILGNGSGKWTVAQNASQFMELPGGITTTTGIGGSISATNVYDCVTIAFSETANSFDVTNIAGNIIYV